TRSSFILANTEQLHAKILQLSDRVRQLEDGLHTLYSSHSNETHPLLVPELLQIKTSQEFYINPQTLPIPSETVASQREESLRESVGALSLSSIRTDHSFEHERERVGQDLKIRARIRAALPAREEAYRVCEEARTNALWAISVLGDLPYFSWYYLSDLWSTSTSR
ncbi:hypothetical protein MPER_05285, partial [Moniliophthora perniciosa FA553]